MLVTLSRTGKLVSYWMQMHKLHPVTLAGSETLNKQIILKHTPADFGDTSGISPALIVSKRSNSNFSDTIEILTLVSLLDPMHASQLWLLCPESQRHR